MEDKRSDPEDKTRNFQLKRRVSFVARVQDFESLASLYQGIQAFIYKCLRRLLRKRWTDRVSNGEIWKIAWKVPVGDETGKR